MRIIVTGQSWHGSDVTALARGFRAHGCAVDLIGTDQFFPALPRTLPNRVLGRLLARGFRGNFNQAIVRSNEIHRPEIVVVFKGTHVLPETLAYARATGAWLCNFYPDVTLHGHHGLDLALFPMFDHVFTTKSFGVEDYRKSLGLTAVSYLPHGFDPLVHRPIKVHEHAPERCDVSFIGTWSPHKERLLNGLLESRPMLDVRIWGGGWERAQSRRIREVAAGYPIVGDYYALAINASKINLGLLSEVRAGASSGDQITSRTFHIPASGGFMLHQRTSELVSCLNEGTEVGCFDDLAELIDKVDFYLAKPDLRCEVAIAGRERCLRDHSHEARAAVILETYRARRMLSTGDSHEDAAVG